MAAQKEWDKRFLDMCQLISSWSKDPSTKCGAVIVDEYQRVVATGYNGFPRGVKDVPGRLSSRDVKYDLTMHAETNAVLFAQRSLKFCTIYNVPMFPCIRCAVLIVQSGISRVVTPKLPMHLHERWGESIQKSKSVFKEAGLKYIELDYKI